MMTYNGHIYLPVFHFHQRMSQEEWHEAASGCITMLVPEVWGLAFSEAIQSRQIANGKGRK